MKDSSLLSRISKSRLFLPVGALVLILAFDAVYAPGFFKLGVIEDPVYGNHLYGNLIVEAAKNATNTPLPIIVLADLAAGTLCGLWNGLLVTKAKIQPIVATLVLMVAGRGIAQLITNGQIMTIYYTPYFWFGNGFILGIPVSVYIVLAVAILAWVLVRKTAIGLFLESVGTNAKASYSWRDGHLDLHPDGVYPGSAGECAVGGQSYVGHVSDSPLFGVLPSLFEQTFRAESSPT
jgi:ABC-type glucose/galactose transport system permease subunit